MVILHYFFIFIILITTTSCSNTYRDKETLIINNITDTMLVDFYNTQDFEIYKLRENKNSSYIVKYLGLDFKDYAVIAIEPYPKIEKNFKLSKKINDRFVEDFKSVQSEYLKKIDSRLYFIFKVNDERYKVECQVINGLVDESTITILEINSHNTAPPSTRPLDIVQ